MLALVLLLFSEPLSLRLEGKAFQMEQSPRPGGPYLETDLIEEIFVDPDGTVVHEVISRWPYFASHLTTIVRGEEVIRLDHGRKTFERRTEGASAVRARVSRRHPSLVTRPIDQNRVTALEWHSPDPLLGERRNRIEYVWDGDRPDRMRQFENGRLAAEARYASVRRGREATRPPVEIPDGYRASDPPPTARPALQPLGERLYLLRNAGGADYHSLVIEFAERLVIVEAPRSEAAAKEAIAVIRSRFPSLPITDVVVTHHHSDHIAGLRPYADEGARILTTAGNKPYLKSLFGGRQRVEVVASGHEIGDNTNRLVLFDAGPTEHATEVLVAWLPRQRVLFQGDLFRYVPGAPEAPRLSARQFAEFIAAKALDVRIVAGVHGEPAPIEALSAVGPLRQ